ncbi:hypothetical protein [Mesorhizobium sp. AA22]|uniref:hypothetical protein n=1 Tax=Mesorhizobium sp. AA22 TaxID=1854057 RepID=UPI0007FBC5F4|nr:hypothetical protein [Mesorhizobium sp. AA22]QIA21426.1 hypothetical protein A9K68_006140 [Mesorhizobium sp. AA22]
MAADMFFSRLRGIEVFGIVRAFLALSMIQVKPEMGMPAMRRKQVALCRGNSPPIAAQHF